MLLYCINYLHNTDIIYTCLGYIKLTVDHGIENRVMLK